MPNGIVPDEQRFELFALAMMLCAPTALNQQLGTQGVSEEQILQQEFDTRFSPEFRQHRDEVKALISDNRHLFAQLGTVFGNSMLWSRQPPHPKGADVDKILTAMRDLQVKNPIAP